MSPQVLTPVGAPALVAPPPSAALRAAAGALQQASRLLARLAQRLDRPAAVAATRPPQLEFHAEAGAPEGALYADGVLVGMLPGVTRL